MDSNLAPNDPYGKMNSAGQNVRPGFLGGGNENAGGVTGGAMGAMNDLRRAETGAAKNPIDQNAAKPENLMGAKTNEEKAGGFYSGSGKTSSDDAKKKGGFAGFLKKGGPMGIITLLIVGVGGLMGGSQSLMPFAIGEMVIEKFNTVGISSTVASDSWLDLQLNQGVRTEALTTGQTEGTYAFSEHQVNELERMGILVVNDNSASPPITALLYLKNNETYVPVVGSAVLQSVSSGQIVSRIAAASGLSNIGEPVSTKVALSDVDFKTPYTTASKSWRGGSSGWFDQMMSKVTDVKLGITRNRWMNFAVGKLKAANNGINNALKAEFDATASLKDAQWTDMGDDRGTQDYGVWTEFEDVDADGNPYTYWDWDVVENRKIDGLVVFDNKLGDLGNNPPDGDYEGQTIDLGIEPVESDLLELGDLNGVDVDAESSNLESNFSGLSGDSLNGMNSEEAVGNVLKSKAVKAAAKAKTATGVTCGLTKALIAIFITVSAYQTVQFQNQTSGYLEATDKAKAGDGDESPINEYNNNLTTPAPTTDRDGKVVEGRESRSGMDSQGVSWLFGSKFKIDNNDPSVQTTNIESALGSLGGIFGGVFSKVSKLGDAYTYCLMAQIAEGVLGVVLGIATAGVSGLVQEVFDNVTGVVISTAVMVGIAIVLPVIIKQVAKIAMKDVATEWFGEDLGNALVSGASKYLGGNGTSGGQSPGSQEKVMAYLNTQQTVIAEEAEYQRSRRSPFDIRSQYTFLGSLAYSLLPMAYSGGGLMRTMTNVSNLTSTSIASLMPTASAIDSQSAINSRGDCPLLESVIANTEEDSEEVEAVSITGDAYCNPYIITDVETIEESPIEVSEIVHAKDNFEDDGTIKEGSNLAKYVTYCGQRTSPYGIQDAAIAGDVTGQNTAKTILGYVPIAGDIAGAISDSKELANMPWITGGACVASSENDLWEDNQYYQRYAENERLLENMNPGYKSTVTAYIEEYYRKNPVDNSFEGTLARFSGQTKEEVEDVLALIEYYQYLDSYRPEDRLAFGETKKESKKEIRFDNDNRLARNPGILLNLIAFADVRNRNFAV